MRERAISAAVLVPALLIVLAIGGPAIALAIAIAGLSLLRTFLLRRNGQRAGGTWGCGFPYSTPRMQYTASSYAAPLLSSFGSLSGVRAHADAAGFHSHPIDLVLDGVVAPAWRQVGRVAREARLLQAGRLRWYLLYVILTVLALLLYVSRTPGAR